MYINIGFLIDFFSFILMKNDIRNHFLNYLLNLNLIFVLVLFFKVIETEVLVKKIVFNSLFVCFVVFCVEISMFKGWERSGGIFAIFRFFWSIFVIGLLLKNYLSHKKKYRNIRTFLLLIGLLITQIFSILEKAFSDLLVANSAINTYIVFSILTYIGFIISNFLFIYAFSIQDN